LKNLIKERTTSNGTTSPVSIPGQEDGSPAWTQLEEELFLILCDQHERVNLFTKSKYGEFERRLDHINRQVRLLSRGKKMQATRPIQNSNKFATLVNLAAGVGEDIQSLSRYVATQKQAFRKILKKYRKWTGSSGLESRMKKEVFNQPASVLNLDFTPLLDRFAGANSSLRALKESDHSVGERQEQKRRPSSAMNPPKPRSSAALLHQEYLHSSRLDFDAAFTALPLGTSGGRATYWIHDDNLEEATVLLRRYMKDRQSSASPSPTSRDPPSTTFSLPRRDSGRSDLPSDRTHIAMFDNLHRFVKAYGAVTVGQAEDLVGSVASLLAMSILWSSDPEAIVITSDLSPPATPTQLYMDVAHMKTQDLVKLFQQESGSHSKSSKESRSKSSSFAASLQAHRDWLAKNRDIKPLAEVQSTRSRFAGLNNTSEVGTWALMDIDVSICSVDTSTIGQRSGSDSTNAQKFPHTVLEVRWEFSRTPEIVRALDSTHLVERVRGFSMEAQAIIGICKPSGMPTPMWQPLLERDIRKVPPLQTKMGLRKPPAKATSSGPSSTEDPSTSMFSASVAQSSATSVQDSNVNTPVISPTSAKQKAAEMPHAPNMKPARRKSRQERQAIKRYWNEFDDGELREDETYAIYINPDDNTTFPGAETISKAFSSMYQSLGRSKRRIISWLPMQSRQQNADAEAEEGVRRPLLGFRGSDRDQEIEESSDTDIDIISSAKRSKRRRSTAHAISPTSRRTSLQRAKHNHRHHVPPSRETALFRTYLGCYGIAFVLLIMSAILKATGRHKAKMQVDAGVIVGVIAATGSAIIAISLMISREERLSWLHRGLGGGAFLMVCIGSGWLLAVVGKSL
jgi:VTC domain